MNKLSLAASFLRTTSKKDGEKALKELKRYQDLENAVKNFLDCPYSIDTATVPKAGIDAAPQQVVLNVSVGYIYYKNIEKIIKDGEPKYISNRCNCGRLSYYQREFGYKCACGEEIFPETKS